MHIKNFSRMTVLVLGLVAMMVPMVSIGEPVRVDCGSGYITSLLIGSSHDTKRSGLIGLYVYLDTSEANAGSSNAVFSSDFNVRNNNGHVIQLVYTTGRNKVRFSTMRSLLQAAFHAHFPIKINIFSDDINNNNCDFAYPLHTELKLCTSLAMCT